MQTIRTPEKAAKVLKQLSLGRSVAAACRAARISRNAYYDWRKDDPDFLARTDEAIEEGTDRLEDEANRRALRTSDTMLIFLLKSRRPEKYRETQRHEHVGDADQPLTVVVKRVTGTAS